MPLRQVDHTADQSRLHTSSLEGYGAPIIDIGHWWVGADYARVVGTMRNFIPERMVRATGQMMRMNIDDGDIFIGEYTNGALGSIQTSFVDRRQLPRHRGADLRKPRARSSAGWSRSSASPRRSRSPRRTPSSSRSWRSRALLPGRRPPEESWRSLFYANLIKDFIDEIIEGGERNQGNFDDGAWVQEVINAVELSFHERRWVDLPLES